MQLIICEFKQKRSSPAEQRLKLNAVNKALVFSQTKISKLKLYNADKQKHNIRVHLKQRKEVQAMSLEKNGRIGNLPANINIMNPVPNKDAKSITGLVRRNGRISGYELSDGRVLSKSEGVSLAKQGGIRGVAIASRNGSEYLRSLPDGSESNNLGDLPSATAKNLKM